MATKVRCDNDCLFTKPIAHFVDKNMKSGHNKLSLALDTWSYAFHIVILWRG